MIELLRYLHVLYNIIFNIVMTDIVEHSFNEEKFKGKTLLMDKPLQNKVLNITPMDVLPSRESEDPLKMDGKDVLFALSLFQS